MSGPAAAASCAYCGMDSAATCSSCGNRVCAPHYIVDRRHELHYLVKVPAYVWDAGLGDLYVEEFWAGPARCVECRHRSGAAAVSSRQQQAAELDAHANSWASQLLAAGADQVRQLLGVEPPAVRWTPRLFAAAASKLSVQPDWTMSAYTVEVRHRGRSNVSSRPVIDGWTLKWSDRDADGTTVVSAHIDTSGRPWWHSRQQWASPSATTVYHSTKLETKRRMGESQKGQLLNRYFIEVVHGGLFDVPSDGGSDQPLDTRLIGAVHRRLTS